MNRSRKPPNGVDWHKQLHKPLCSNFRWYALYPPPISVSASVSFSISLPASGYLFSLPAALLLPLPPSPPAPPPPPHFPLSHPALKSSDGDRWAGWNNASSRMSITVECRSSDPGGLASPLRAAFPSTAATAAASAAP